MSASLKEEFLRPNTSADATCDELVVNKNHSRYEKSNLIERCLGGHSSDVRFVLEHAGDEHNHNASNHGNDSPTTAHANDDYNDAHGRRLLTVLY